MQTVIANKAITVPADITRIERTCMYNYTHRSNIVREGIP